MFQLTKYIHLHCKKIQFIYLLKNLYTFYYKRKDTSKLSSYFIETCIRKQIDGNLVLDVTTNTKITDFEFKNFCGDLKETDDNNLYIGNYSTSLFCGLIDKVRLYKTQITSENFNDHIFYDQGYSLGDPHNIANNLFLKLNFDLPVDISSKDGLGYGQIENSAIDDSMKYVKLYNFTNTEYPYDFEGSSTTQYAKLPSFGSQAFSNAKIRHETQIKTVVLNPKKSVTRKELDRVSIDNNTVLCTMSPTDILNREIIRFFGNFDIGEYIGDPLDLYETEYKKFEQFRKVFYKEGFGKIDWRVLFKHS